MKNKYITLFLLLLVLVIAAIVVFDNKTDKVDTTSYLTTNPLEKDVAAYESVADSLMSHVETKQIRVNATNLKAIDYKGGEIYLLADDYLQVIRTNGSEVKKTKLDEGTTCMTVLKDKRVLVGFKDHLVLLDVDLTEMKHSAVAEKALFTAVANKGDLFFVADAGLKRVIVYDNDLKQINSFKGESGVSDQYGFVVPSAHFDLAVNDESELWVVNPGMHALQNYSDKGKLRGFWSKTSFENDGFSGCCNPFHIAFLPDGSFVTSEKGLVRIKIHEPSGLLRSVVASPKSFKGERIAPDVAVDEQGGILALDYEKKMIRFFEPK
jgi:DNA-binding protein